MDGGAHARALRGGDRRRCWPRCSSSCRAHRIHLEGMILKPNMVISGKKCRDPRDAGAGGRGHCALSQAPRAAAPCPASRSCPAARSPAEATLHLSLMNASGPLPWQLTFSYGRALQDAALQAWGGKRANVAGRPEGVPEMGAPQRPGAQRRASRPAWNSRPRERPALPGRTAATADAGGGRRARRALRHRRARRSSAG